LLDPKKLLGAVLSGLERRSDSCFSKNKTRVGAQTKKFWRKLFESRERFL